MSSRWRAFWLSIGWLLVMGTTYLSVAPAAFRLPDIDGDKVGHFLAYAVSMFWFTQLYRDKRSRVRLAFGLIFLGLGLEVVQGYMAARTFDLGDVLANATGASFGWLIAPPRTPHLLKGVEGATWKIARVDRRRSAQEGLTERIRSIGDGGRQGSVLRRGDALQSDIDTWAQQQGWRPTPKRRASDL